MGEQASEKGKQPSLGSKESVFFFFLPFSTRVAQSMDVYIHVRIHLIHNSKTKTCFSPFLTIHNKDKNRRKKLESNSCRKETKRKGREAS